MKYGANPNSLDSDRSTTMHHAAMHSNIDMIKILLNVNNEYKNSFNWVC